jgi:hypothetical protein
MKNKNKLDRGEKNCLKFMRKYQVLASNTVNSGSRSVPNSMLISELMRDTLPLLDRLRLASVEMLFAWFVSDSGAVVEFGLLFGLVSPKVSFGFIGEI